MLMYRKGPIAISLCYSHISLSFFRCFFVIIILSTTCRRILTSLSLFILTIQTSTPNPPNPSWWTSKDWKASRVTPDKITTTHSVFLRFSYSSYITNRTNNSSAHHHVIPFVFHTNHVTYASLQYNHPVYRSNYLLHIL